MTSPDSTAPLDESRGQLGLEASDLLGLFQFSLEMLCIAGGDGYFRHVNPAFERILGYNTQELVSRPFLDFVHPEDQQKTQHAMDQLRDGIPVTRFENRYRCCDGSYRWLSWKATPRAGGEQIYAVASDVTERKQVEAALRDSEHRYRQLLEAVTSYTYSVELKDGVPLSTVHSTGCLATTGYTPEDFAADPYLWINLVHADDRNWVQCHAAQVLLEDGKGPIEHRILHRDGSVRWVRHTVASHRDGQGQLVRYDGVIEDITERKVSQERFRLLVESAPDAMVVVDGNGQIVLVNAQAERLFGYLREEMLGRSVELLVPEGSRAQHAKDRKAFAAGREARKMGAHPDLKGVRKGGGEFPVEIALSPISTEQGLLVCAAIRDLTERRRAEEALRSSEERFDLAVRGTAAGIWDWDLRTNIVYFSPRWKSMLGYEDHEIDSDFQEWESRLHPDDRRRALATIWEYLEGRMRDYEVEHRLRHKDGTYRCIIARGAAVCDAMGKPYRMVGSHIDVTERRQAQEALRAKEVQLLAAREIQEHLLPRSPPVVPGFQIAGASYPSEFASGDLIDYLDMPGGYLGLGVGDVAGHGIGPAILMASTHSHLHSLAESSPAVDEVLMRANNRLLDETDSDHFVTMLLARLDPRSRTLVYSSAGHPNGYVIDRHGQVRSELRSTSFPLGIVRDAVFPLGQVVALQAGDVVVLPTDGLTEVSSPEGCPFGQRRLIEVVARHRDLSAAEIVDALYEAVAEFSGGGSHPDDISLIVVKVESGDEPAPSAE